jgi:AraC-like DNA-binding protein
MVQSAFPIDIALPGAVETFDVYDPQEMDTTSRISRRLVSDMHMLRYQLRDRSLLRQHFDQPISSHFTRRLGEIAVTHVGDRFATQLDIDGDGMNSYCFNAMLAGTMAIYQDGREATSAGSAGLVFRARPGTRVLAGDGSGRANFWVDAALLERTLERMLGEELRRPLDFALSVAWGQGLAASLRAQIRYLVSELARPDGLASNPVALATFSDLAVQTALHGLPHNYTDRLVNGRYGPVPAYVRRAEEFMRVHAAVAIRMEEVAGAAGCSLRTLELAFRDFCETTPLGALRVIRLEQVRAVLLAGAGDASTGEIARRYGFTNPGRFVAAYRRRFGEPPPRRPNACGEVKR